MLTQFRWLKNRRFDWLIVVLTLNLLMPACRVASTIGGLDVKADEMQSLSIDEFRSVFGTKYLMSSAYIIEESAKSFGSYDSYGGKSHKTFNYVFLNPDDLTSQLLLPHSSFFFVDAQELPLWKEEKEQYKEPYELKPQLKTEKPPRPPTQLLIYTLVKANTNDNKILDYSDRKTVAISDVSGSNYAEIIQDVDAIIHQQMYSADEFMMVYLSHGKYTAMRLHLKTRQITLTKELAPIPKPQQPLG